MLLQKYTYRSMGIQKRTMDVMIKEVLEEEFYELSFQK